MIVQEYSSDEESEAESEKEEISENEDGGFDITFKLPDYLNKTGT